ncbi:MAG: MFS transporter [Kosmotoga sp.]|nr:MAG: MFS transporter [Kosmotoga sp.]
MNFIKKYPESFLIFFIYASRAAKNLFSQYFDQIGFSASQIGILMAILPVVTLFVNPLWFKMGEKYTEKKIYVALAIMTAFTIWGVFIFEGFIPKLIFFSVASFFYASVIPLGESRIITSLKIKKRLYGRVRLWGTIGFGTTAVLIGMLVKTGFYNVFLVFSAVMLFSLPFLKHFSFTGTEKPKAEKQEECGRKGTFSTFLLLTTGMFCGVTMNAFHNTFIPLLTREKGFDVSSVGIVFMAMAFSEIPFLFFADKIVKRLGYLPVLTAGIFFEGIRIILVTLSSSLIMLIFSEFLHGLTYILVYFSLFTYIHYELPKDQITRAQSIFWVVRSGLTYITGSLLGGFLIDMITTVTAFRTMGIFALSVSFFITLISLFSRWKKRTA